MWRIFAAHLFFLPSLVGSGAILSHWVRLRRSPSDRAINLGEHGLLGMFLVVLVGAVVNLVLPISPAVRIFALLIGYAGLWIHRRELSGALSRGGWIALGVVTLFSLPNCYFSTLAFDSGFYYMPIQKWFEESPVPFGRGNLHVFWGYNHFWFLLQTMLDVPWLPQVGSYCINSFQFVLLFASAWAFFADDKGMWAGPRSLIRPLLLVSFLFFSTQPGPIWLGVGSSDINHSISRFIFYILILNLLCLEDPGDRVSQRLSWILSVFLVTLKTTGLFPMIGTLIVLALVNSDRLRSLSRLLKETLRDRSFQLAVALGLPWILHGVITTGCFVYPIGLTCLRSLPWTITPSQLDAQHRDSASGVNGFLTMSPDEQHVKFLEQISSEAKLIVGTFGPCLALGIALILICLLRPGGVAAFRRSRWKPAAILACLLLVTSAVILKLSPRMRYCFAALSILSALPAALGSSLWNETLIRSRRFALVCLVTLCLLTTVQLRFMLGHHDGFNKPWPRFDHYKAGAFEKKVSPRGDEYYAAQSIFCWNFPVPCLIIPWDNLQASRWLGRPMYSIPDPTTVRHEYFYSPH